MSNEQQTRPLDAQVRVPNGQLMLIGEENGTRRRCLLQRRTCRVTRIPSTSPLTSFKRWKRLDMITSSNEVIQQQDHHGLASVLAYDRAGGSEKSAQRVRHAPKDPIGL